MERGLTAARDLLTDVAPGPGSSPASAPPPSASRTTTASSSRPTFPGWGELPFGQLVRDAFPGIPVRLGTDVKAAAAAELRWGALTGCDPGLYLNLGTGLATAIVAGGTVISGAHGASGEIGYNLRSAADVWIAPTSARILEHVVSGQALETTGSARLGRPVTAADVFAMASRRSRTPPYSRTSSIANWRCMSSTWRSPSTRSGSSSVADWSGAWDRIAPELRRALDAAVPFPPELTVARFPSDAPLVGHSPSVSRPRARPRCGGIRMTISSRSERQRR